jgi:hypothetical protein
MTGEPAAMAWRKADLVRKFIEAYIVMYLV